MDYQELKQRLDKQSSDQELRRAFYSPYWLKVGRLTRYLIGLWVIVVLSFVAFSPSIQADWLGVPVAYWLITAVMLPIFLLLVAYYAWKMDRFDEQAYLETIEGGSTTIDQAVSNAGDTTHEAQQGRG